MVEMGSCAANPSLLFLAKPPPIATTSIQSSSDLPQEFFCRPAQAVTAELIGCLLLNSKVGGELLGGVIVETEAIAKA